MPTTTPTDRNTALDTDAARLTQHMATHHRGVEHGVTAGVLALAMGWPQRRLRHVITHARSQGLALCARPATGYYIATTPDELERASAFLHARAMTTLQLLARMRNVSLPALLGQLQLPS